MVSVCVGDHTIKSQFDVFFPPGARPRASGLAVGPGYFFGDDRHSALYGSSIPGVGHTNAFVLVWPIVVQSNEKIVSWYDQHAPLFQSLIQLLAGDWQAFKPQPQEDGAFRFVYVVGQSAQLLTEPAQGLL